MIVTKKIIKSSIKKTGLQNKSICIHSSLKSFGFVEDGAKTIINAFLEENVTIVAPTFSYDFETTPLNNKEIPKQNAYCRLINKNNKNKIYNPNLNEIHESMGVIPEYILSIKNRIRGSHPLCSFTAIGKHAKKIIINQTPNDIFAPLKELIKMKGYLILMGVDLTKVTAIHLAENLAGRNLFIRWANNKKGQPIPVKIGGCSDGFYKLEPYIKNIENNIIIGKCLWRIFSINEFVIKIKEAIINNPQITKCDTYLCKRCEAAIKGGPILK